VDHQGNPQVGQNQTLRLITQDKVVAMLGAYHSSVALVATAVAERQGIPFLVGDSVALNITGRGFKWIFRSGPIASDFAAAYTQFLNDLRKAGRKIDTIAIVNENTEYGTSVAASINEAAKRAGINVGAQIPYNANSTDVSGQVLQLKQLQPDAVIFISYTADTILYFKTLKNLDYLPPIIIGDDAGFSDPAFIPNVGDIAQGAINRSAWDVGKPGSNTYKINELFKAKYGRDLDDTSARWMQGFLVLADAIQPRRLDRAGEDPSGAARDRSQARTAHDRLSRRQIRRDRPEYAVGDLSHPASGQGVQVRVAGEPRDRQARMADEGLAQIVRRSETCIPIRSRPSALRHSGARAKRGSPESIITGCGYGFRARAFWRVPE